VADFLESILTRSRAAIIESAGNDFDDSGKDAEKEQYNAAFDNILGELVTAIGLQRFRLMSAGEEVRPSEEGSDEIAKASLATKTSHIHSSAQPPPPPT